ncbi:MAG: mechanosensitive ion channel [Endomicrobiales bacterium]|nr:mechanosensitive ion channel [Endomicrobiales bacterium]
MSGFTDIFNELVVNTLEASSQFLMQVGPKIAFSLFILLTGWIFAVLIKKVFSKILKAAGFDVLSEKAMLTQFLEKGGVQKKPSLLVGTVFYWMILFSAFIMIFDTLQLEVASQMLKDVIILLPILIIAVILLALGIFLGQFVGKFVDTSARLARVPMHSIIGKISQYVIIGLAFMIILEYLGIPGVIIRYIIPALIIIPFIVLIIAGREIISNLLASRIVNKDYKIEDMIEIDNLSGKIESIDALTTKIRKGKTQIIIPNIDFVRKIVKKSEV